jgi:hypothetical protein
MDASVLDDIQRFLNSVEKQDLFEYLDVEQAADEATVTHALQVRRSWAQGQQANPKFRNEALWLIKNIENLKTALITERADYLLEIKQRHEETKLETLSIFIKGTLTDGELTARGEEAIELEGEQLGLTESVIIRRIGEILAERDAGTIFSETPDLELTDLYETLDTPPDSDPTVLEEAYRARYRWARQLRDPNQSSTIYGQLDEAWRVLKDPERRAAYDAERKVSQGPTDKAQTTDVDKIAFLPPPPPSTGLALPTPTVAKQMDNLEVQTAPVDPESGDSDPMAPLINMPTAAPELKAPPPPTIPEPGEATADEFGHNDGNESTTAQPTQEKAPVESDPFNDEPIPGSVDLHIVKNPEPSDFGGMDFHLPGSSSWQEHQAMDSLLDDTAEEPLVEVHDDPSIEEIKAMVMNRVSAAADTHQDGPALDAGQIFGDDPILKLVTPKTIRMRTGTHPTPVRIHIENAGDGEMRGTITANVKWIQISPTVLDPNRKQQTIEALVEPNLIKGNAARGTVTIETQHGDSETVNIDAVKHVISPVTMFVSALSLVGCIGLLAGMHFMGIIGEEPAPPIRTILAIYVDPPAGEVYVDNNLVGNQGTMSIVDGFPVDQPFQVRVELDGFEPFTEDVMVPTGTQYRVEAELLLRDNVDFQPTTEMSRADIDIEALDTLLLQREEQIQSCFSRNLRTLTPFRAEIEVSCVVTVRGFIHGVQFSNANFRSPSIETCLKRQMRALQLPLINGDYGVFTRTFGADIQQDTALNSGDSP